MKNRTHVQTILKPLFDYYKERELKIARLAYQKGATGADMARALDITPQAVAIMFPKNKLITGDK